MWVEIFAFASVFLLIEPLCKSEKKCEKIFGFVAFEIHLGGTKIKRKRKKSDTHISCKEISFIYRKNFFGTFFSYRRSKFLNAFFNFLLSFFNAALFRFA